jgi:arylsulfatase A-like enzyme
MALSGDSLRVLGASSGDPPRPNFVFFCGEGVRPDQLSAAKPDGWNGPGLSAEPNKIIATPHLDRLVKEGITFPNAFTTNALCLPSRSGILTGLYTHETGCIDNGATRKIPDDIPTVVDLLRGAGYEVAFFGKIHVHGETRRYWDYFFGYEEAGTDDYAPTIITSERGKAGPPRQYARYENGILTGFVDDIVTDRALAWLNQKHEKPFCLFLWFTSPHAPFLRARRYLDLYNGIKIPKPVTFDDDLKGYPGKPLAFIQARNKIGHSTEDNVRCLEGLVKSHCAGVVSNDDNAGRVMAALEKAGILDDTALIWTADHGFFLGEWDFWDKRFMHEPSIRVPLAFRYPRVIQPGLAPTEMALNLDIPATILDLAGIQIPDWYQGRSLVPFMKGTPPADWRQDWLYEYYEFPGLEHVRPHRGVRTERYKLIHYFLPPEEFELYDLQGDPGELHNLAYDPAHLKLRNELFSRIEQLRQETGDTYQYQEPNVFEYQKEQQDQYPSFGGRGPFGVPPGPPEFPSPPTSGAPKPAGGPGRGGGRGSGGGR